GERPGEQQEAAPLHALGQGEVLVAKFGAPRDIVVDDVVEQDPVPACNYDAMLDHLSIQCTDVSASARFYDTVLATIGGVRILELRDAIGECVPTLRAFCL